MTYAFYARRTIAALTGAGLAGLCAYYAYDYYQSVSAPIAVLVGALLLHLAEACRHERYYIRAVGFTVLAATAVLISVIATVNRVAGTHDARVAEAKTQNLGGEQAGLSLEDAKAALASAISARQAECGNGDPKQRGPQCRKKEDEERTARAALAPARQAVTAAGAQVVEDPGARRLAAVLPVLEATIQLYEPLLLPVWLELTALATLTYGLAPIRRLPAPNPPARVVQAAVVRPRDPGSRDARPGGEAEAEPVKLKPVEAGKPAPLARNLLVKTRNGGHKPTAKRLEPPKTKKPAVGGRVPKPAPLIPVSDKTRGLVRMLADIPTVAVQPSLEQQVVRYCRAYRAVNGELPMLDDIRAKLGVGKATASRGRAKA